MLNLVTVVGENTHILPHMLNHYRNIVDNIYVVVYRQSDNDGILEEIEELGIKPYWVVTEPKYNWERVTHIYNTVKLSKPDEWWIVSDDDELQVYSQPLKDITEHCDRQGYTFVSGGFLDRIGIDGTFPKVTRATKLHEAFPMAGFFRYPMSGACPNKVTLMKGHQKITSGQHFALFDDGSNSWGTSHPKRMPVEEEFAQVHHFKWDESCVERILKVADIKKDYAYSQEYRKMFHAIRKNGYKIDINNPEFLVDHLIEFSYIDYMDYPYWDELTKKIIKI